MVDRDLALEEMACMEMRMVGILFVWEMLDQGSFVDVWEMEDGDQDSCELSKFSIDQLIDLMNEQGNV